MMKTMHSGTGGVSDIMTYLGKRLSLHHTTSNHHHINPRAVLGALDRQEFDKFFNTCSSNITFKFSDNPALHGIESLKKSIQELMSVVQSMKHHIKHEWRHGRNVVLEGTVTYTLKNGKVVDVPFCDVWELDKSDNIREYKIYCSTEFLH